MDPPTDTSKHKLLKWMNVIGTKVTVTAMWPVYFDTRCSLDLIMSITQLGLSSWEIIFILQNPIGTFRQMASPYGMPETATQNM